MSAKMDLIDFDHEYKRTFQKDLGEFLRQKRIAAGISQIEIARAAKFSNAQFISNIERGLCSVPGYILNTMVGLYQIEKVEMVEYLIDLKKEYYGKLVFGKFKKRAGTKMGKKIHKKVNKKISKLR